jgi:hypothetical protein
MRSGGVHIHHGVFEHDAIDHVRQAGVLEAACDTIVLLRWVTPTPPRSRRRKHRRRGRGGKGAAAATAAAAVIQSLLQLGALAATVDSVRSLRLGSRCVG